MNLKSEAMKNKNMEMARRIAEKVKEDGGSTYFVGGFVRDRLMGIGSNDVDIEVHGIMPGKLTEILDSIGEHTEMGASFGIYGLRHYDIDIAMPRSERATGHGHRDFAVSVDPFLGTEKAARRRDFTVNAMMEDVLTGELTDHFNGKEDMEKKLLRHVDDVSFAEDPLRVLRAAQFASRFGFTVDEDTVRLCSSMELSNLPRERIMGELEKALLGSSRPSVFFEVLAKMDRLNFWFLQYADLGKEKRMKTDELLDSAAVYRDKARFPLYFMLSALCMDMDDKGSFIEKLTSEKDLKAYVMNMCALADRPRELFEAAADGEQWNILFDSSVCPEDLLLLSSVLSPDGKAEAYKKTKLDEFKKLMAKPCVMGRDLIAAGLRPDINFTKFLNYAHSLRLKGIEKDEALKKTLEYAKSL